MANYVVNPKTGRNILVGGPTYNEVIKDPKYKSKLKNSPVIKGKAPGTKNRLKGKVMPASEVSTLKRGKERSLLAALKDNKSNTKKRAVLEKQLLNKSRGKGKSTRGWGGVSPQRGKERIELQKNCGDRCFLMPKTRSFPVCPKQTKTDKNCSIDCRGVLSAKIRAKQWKYDEVARVAEEVGKRKGCSWAKK